MIKSISIFNFLSHKFTDIEFSKGLNIIVGKSDSGKSAIVTAIKWVKDNRPLGDGYRSKWGGDTEVIINADNCTVVRKKTDKDSFYYVNDLKFTAFKTNVPDEVQKALNLDYVNLQTQFKGHYLLDSNSSEVARHFNNIARLDKIDTALGNVNKWIKQTNQEIKSDQRQIEDLENELSKLPDFDIIEKKIQYLEKAEKYLNRLSEDCNNLDELLDDIDCKEEEIEKLQYVEYVDNSINELQEEFKLLQDIQENIQNLVEIINDIVLNENAIVGYERQLEEYLEEYQGIVGKACPFCGNKIKSL